MKPGYKIIIAGLLIYGGFETKKMMDIIPYKEYASKFAEFLKQKKPFEAQELLSERLQSIVSIEQISSLVDEYNLTQVREVDWSDWRGDDGNYTLRGFLKFKDNKSIAVEFTLSSTEENKTKIESVKIADSNLSGVKDPILGL